MTEGERGKVLLSGVPRALEKSASDTRHEHRPRVKLER